MAEPAIQVRNLIKRYGDLHAVDDISFEIKKGDVFAFLGPNGAGKTTTVEIIETIRTPTSGEVEILGLDIRKNRKEIIQRIGVLPQEFSSFDRITVRETLQYYQRLFGGGRDIDELLKMVNLEGEKDKLYMNLSGGLKQRVGIAVALVNDPEVVFLDEPTSGLDPQGRKEILELIMDISSKKDIQVLISSHILPDVEHTCSYVVILNKGEMAAEGQISELKQVQYSLYELKIKGEEEAFLKRLAKMESQVEQTEDKLLKVYLPPGTDPQKIFKIAVEENVQVRHFVKSQTSLEDLFAKVVGVD